MCNNYHKRERLHLKKYSIKESETKDLYQTFAQKFDGVWDGENLKVDHPEVKIDITFFHNIFGVSLSINQVQFTEDTVIEIAPDKDPLLISRFILDSTFNLPHRDNLFVGPNYENGVLLSNTSTPIEIHLPKGELIRWIAIRIRMEDWEQIHKGRFPKLDHIFKSEEPWIIAKPINSLMEKSLQEILLYQSKEYGHKVFSIAKAIELSALLFTQLIKEGEEGGQVDLLKEDYEVIMQVKSLLQQNYINAPKIDDLSMRFGQSSSKLRQNFKKVIGLPIHQFVMKERYAEAYKRIVENKDTITEIAIDLGFSNIAHFSDGFKKQFSISPSKLRTELPD